jgi:hypothetical protein
MLLQLHDHHTNACACHMHVTLVLGNQSLPDALQVLLSSTTPGDSQAASYELIRSYVYERVIIECAALDTLKDFLHKCSCPQSDTAVCCV